MHVVRPGDRDVGNTEDDARNERKIVLHPARHEEVVEGRHGGDADHEQPGRDIASVIQNPSRVVPRQEDASARASARGCCALRPASADDDYEEGYRRNAENLFDQVEAACGELLCLRTSFAGGVASQMMFGRSWRAYRRRPVSEKTIT